MPQLDVSDVLNDPDFADDTLMCVRQMQSVGTDGRAINTPVSIPFSGVVYPLSGQRLVRRPDGELNTASIAIVTQQILYAGTPQLSADVVQWNGNSYTVTAIDDYSRYGAGFVRATAELIQLAG